MYIVYAKKFQLIVKKNVKKMIYYKKDVKNPSERFEPMNMGLCEFYQNIWDRNIRFSIAEFRFVIKFIVIPQTLR